MLISPVVQLREWVFHLDMEVHIQDSLHVLTSIRERFQEELLESQKTDMATKHSEWHFRLESNISGEIRRQVTFAQLKLCLLTWLPSSCNGMDQTV